MDESEKDSLQRRDLRGLSAWAGSLAEALVSLSSDMALVINTDGTVHEVVQGQGKPIIATAGRWMGQPWVQTVTKDTQRKVRQLLDEVRKTGRGRRREVNLPTDGTEPIPVAYTALELGSGGPILAVGRDLRAQAALQQHFLNAQRDLRISYERTERIDARYRLWFEAATDPLLLVRAVDFRIVAGNRAAADLWNLPLEEIVGRPAAFGFEQTSQTALDALLAESLTSGTPRETVARLSSRDQTSVAVTPLRTHSEALVMMQLRPIDTALSGDELNAAFAQLIHNTTDSVVVTDSAGRVVVSNRSFLRLLQIDGDAKVRGQPLSTWVSVADPPWATLLEKVQRQRVVRGVIGSVVQPGAKVIRTQLVATLLTEREPRRIGITLHPIATATTTGTASATSRLLQQINSLGLRVGHQPLPALLEHTVRAVEHFVVARALEVSQGDSMRAAELLGIEVERLERVGRPQAKPD